ncbi:ATP-binding protein [Aestuariibacter halophilus]|uniref:ATP-binding protein n=1 Tax=Fluctibacter halophilus TaxID=226011 RepID=A0ABS8G5E3_9ALTE|nr:ATP-binding protein [Aestuariibacter halophilus]MCC2614889.1 ATP-binding protein [Aestuariibacter halophilus]
MNKGTLTLLCGKMAAGKSTYAQRLCDDHAVICLSEDVWLAAHYPGQIHSFDDYLRYSAQIKPFIRQHVQALLRAGINVVMDFPANTVRQRAWFVDLCAEVHCQHRLIYLEKSDQHCLQNLAKRRNEQPDRRQFDNEEVFHQVTRYFEPPTASEGLNITVV